MKGVDDNLYTNLESSFLQKYPNYEILLCIADEKDPCVPLARELKQKYPKVDCQILIGILG